MLSDDPNKKLLVRKPRKIAEKGRLWSDSQKIEAVKTVMLLGNVAHAAASLGIPDVTLRSWRRTNWWHELEASLKEENNLQLSTRLQKLVERSLSVVGDRLELGEWVYDKTTGEMVRRPVTMRDAHVVAKDLIEKQQMLDKQIVSAPAEATITERMLKLAETFADLAKKDKPTIEVTDVVYVQQEAEGNVDESLPPQSDDPDDEDDFDEEDPDALHEERSP